jgi:hypothetical protein
MEAMMANSARESAEPMRFDDGDVDLKRFSAIAERKRRRRIRPIVSVGAFARTTPAIFSLSISGRHGVGAAIDRQTAMGHPEGLRPILNGREGPGRNA